MDAKTRYERLFEKASSPRSVDCGRGTIYLFPKHCKSCGQGMKRPASHERRLIKFLFKKSFCSSDCMAAGPNPNLQFKPSVSSDTSTSMSVVETMEEMAFAALEVKRSEESKQTWFGNLARIADKTFTLLSEKLSFLERKTNQRWYESKFYYWVKK